MLRITFAITVTAVLIATIAVRTQPTPAAGVDQAMPSLTAAERAFAKATSELGIRDGFLTFFAPDALDVDPGDATRPPRLIEARAALLKMPPPAHPLGVRLEWEPRYGDVSAATDLGYLTGPYTRIALGEGKPAAAHGVYFSIWKKQRDGTWKVRVDHGISTPAPVAFGADGGVTRAPQAAAKVAAPASLNDVETRFLATLSENVVAAYREWLDESARANREGQLPWLGRQAILDAMGKTFAGVTMRRLHTEVATSGELGFTLSAYSAALADQAAEWGVSLRVWKRTTPGWRIVYEVSRPAPPR